MNKLDPKVKIDIEEILKDLEHYHPRRKGWTWREKPEGGVYKVEKFEFKNMTLPLKNSVPLPAAKYFNNIDPQPEPVITTEIASGRFEDDIRRMRMAAWHGADHIMVIRTTGQSHIDGLLEGTPEGVGGVPITRKQIRASRKACDLIEDEVGRKINFHSYVSGVAGPEVAVLFAEEGINGAHQDPQYNVLYRNVNMYRSFTDAASAKKVMADAGIFQIDGAHNANATAKEGWSVMPELLVQHGLNCAFSVGVGMPKSQIGLSTVPPCAPPSPKLWYDLPYAVALRDIFSEFKFRAQQNTRYIEADIEEATRTHVIDTMISALTHADIQSTITPDEGRNVPWHYNNIRGIETAKQTLVALDGIKELIKIDRNGPLGEMVRDIKERAICLLEEMIEIGGYFAAVEKGFFVDSARYPERNGDGIARDSKGGVGAGSIVEREADYYAPVCSVFGHNHLPAGTKKACDLIDGCTLCKPEKIAYIDEIDQTDNCNLRLAKT
ncbi:MAG: D-ornithine 4,5-aminomutase subunit OraE, partial [Candidatus Riflebacteria bacterium]|nr:D-ornithine 4,5-aminomutase subunit OraE [Candidatus Riflebacteria bacterium]